MRKLYLPILATATLAVQMVSAHGDSGASRVLRANLSAVKEVPAVSSAATGSFRARISADGLSFDYELDYEGLEGSVTQSHIHIGQKFASGGISVWLCKTSLVTVPAGVPADTPVCGEPGGQISEAEGTISAEDVIGPTGQAVPAASFAELLRLIRSGLAYVNVHSTAAPTGEIRGQIRDSKDRDDD